MGNKKRNCGNWDWECLRGGKNMNKKHKLEIVSTDAIISKIKLDGKDISNLTQKVEIRMVAGKFNTAIIHLIPEEMKIDIITKVTKKVRKERK